MVGVGERMSVILTCKLTRSFNSHGILPVILLEANSSFSRWRSFPKAGGIGPVRRFSLSDRLRSLLQRETSGGILPDNLLKCNQMVSSLSNPGSPNSSFGISPAKQFPARSRVLRRVSDASGSSEPVMERRTYLRQKVLVYFFL